MCVWGYEIGGNMKIGGCHETHKVYVDGYELSPKDSLKVRNHSPDGFSWGYCGSGPSQLSLAILLVAGIPKEIAELKYQDFKRDVVASLPEDFRLDIDISQTGEWSVKKVEDLSPNRLAAPVEDF